MERSPATADALRRNHGVWDVMGFVGCPRGCPVMLPPGPVGSGLLSSRTIRPVVAILLPAKGTLQGTSELVAAVPWEGGDPFCFATLLFGSPVKIVTNLSRSKTPKVPTNHKRWDFSHLPCYCTPLLCPQFLPCLPDLTRPLLYNRVRSLAQSLLGALVCVAVGTLCLQFLYLRGFGAVVFIFLFSGLPRRNSREVGLLRGTAG
jgi:hypothetical protein